MKQLLNNRATLPVTMASVFVIAICAILNCCSAIAANPAVKQQHSMTGLSIEYSTVPAGTVKAYLTAKGLRAELPDAKCYFVAKAPKWDVVLYNPQTHKGMKMTTADWCKHRAKWAFMWDDWPTHELIFKVGSDRYSTFRCTKYVLGVRDESGKVIVKTRGMQTQFRIADNTNTSVDGCHILEALVAVPQADGVPIDMTLGEDPRRSSRPGFYVHAKGKDHQLIIRTIKREALADNLFVYPTQIEPVKHEIDLITDSSRVKDIEDALTDR